MREIGKQLVYLAIAIVALVIVITLYGAFGSLSLQTMPVAGHTLPPLPSAQALRQIQQSPVPQYVVAYTDSGFQPSVLTIRNGQTVRFVNDGSRQMWVASVGTSNTDIYPGSSACGSSTFDSCQAIGPGDFWEFTFSQPGTWDFENNLNKSQLGSVTVSAN